MATLRLLHELNEDDQDDDDEDCSDFSSGHDSDVNRQVPSASEIPVKRIGVSRSAVQKNRKLKETLTELTFSSDKADEEEFVPSDSSSEEASQDARDRRKGTRRNQERAAAAERLASIQKKIREKRCLNLLASMMTESLEGTRHTLQVSHNDPLVEFNRPCLEPPKTLNTSIPELFHYLDRTAATSRASPFPNGLEDVKLFKAAVRAEEVPVSSSVPNGSSIALTDGSQRITKTIRYAGRTYTVQETVDRTSKAYAQHAKALRRQKALRLGGVFGELDQAVTNLKACQKISSIEKSRVDWESFKDTSRDLAEELNVNKAGTGFLSEQSFLATVDSARMEMSLEAKRRHKLLTELAEASRSSKPRF